VALEPRYRATVGYDGTDFLGYQIQAKGRTVQGEIERCLKQVTQAKIRIEAAGRTDAGVHATGQVIAFDVAWRHSVTDLHRALNATLPDDIVISELRTVKPFFHPRFSALSRTYHYQVINQRWPNVLQRRYAYHLDQDLDVEAMNKASQLLIGSHDFASFGKPTQGSSTIRTVMQAEWLAKEDHKLIFRITANAFLYRMVRNIVGVLVETGLKRLAVADVKQILAARTLSQLGAPAPACGLCLVNVTYPEEF
jgi:tRNA pseudouridine38-40 synthase